MAKKKKPTVGRPTDLTEELFEKIKQGILDGLTLRDLAKHCKMSEGTLYQWHSGNYSNLADKIEGWKRDRKLMLAERNIEEMLQMSIKNTGSTPTGDTFEYDDTGKLRVKADISKFVAETLGKETYTKRSEVTGKNGGAIETKDVTDEDRKKIDKLLEAEGLT
jgi:transcriptional regulator with XRE-family HTH domain